MPVSCPRTGLRLRYSEGGRTFPNGVSSTPALAASFFIGAVGSASVTNKPIGDRYRHHVRSTCPSTSALAPTTDLRQRCPEQPVLTHSSPRRSRVFSEECRPFSWRWNGGTISTDLDVIWGMPVEITEGILHRYKLLNTISKLQHVWSDNAQLGEPRSESLVSRKERHMENVGLQRIRK